MTTKFIAGNWKMHGSAEAAKAWTQAVRAEFSNLPDGVSAGIFPPAPLIPVMCAALSGSGIAVGGQDCHAQEQGAFTGDISAIILKDAGCSHVIVGHSERRILHGETDDMAQKKAAAAIAAGLVPIICIGETEAEREAGQTEAVLAAQVKGSLPEAKGNFILAYEPVWAIGSGQLPTLEEIDHTHRSIAKLASGPVSVLYGGSVKPGNAREILALSSVGGVLVGGASLKAEDFISILRDASAAAQDQG